MIRPDDASIRARWRSAGAALAATLLLNACGPKDGAAAAAASASRPPPEVGVVTVALRPVTLQTELPGRVEAVRTAQVRARVNGVVQKRLFEEGSLVKAGQPLFQIDAAPYRAALDSARAALARAEANLTQAAAQAKRYQPLVEAKAVSQQEYVNAVAAQKQAEADVAAARAAIQTARISVDYARVDAPIAGRIGRALVTEGALVSAAEATPLALVQQTGSVYVNFTQSTTELLRLRRALNADTLQRAAPKGEVEVRIVLDDGSELPQPGRLLFTDLSVDPSSGQVTLRALVPNDAGLMLPGQYVRVRLAQAEVPAGVLLPQQAVTRGAQGDSVMVVGADAKPVPRSVKVGGALGTQWVVESGLRAGEQVIVDGFQKLAPGSAVKPVAWQPAAAAASGAASGAQDVASAASGAAVAASAASAPVAPVAPAAAAASAAR